MMESRDNLATGKGSHLHQFVTLRVGATKGVLLFIVEIHRRKLINNRKYKMGTTKSVCVVLGKDGP